jgi:hypothetical protein
MVSGELATEAALSTDIPQILRHRSGTNRRSLQTVWGEVALLFRLCHTLDSKDQEMLVLRMWWHDLMLTEDFQLDGGRAGFDHAQFVSRGFGKIQDAAGDIRPAIRDSHLHDSAIVQVQDPHDASQRQFSVSRRVGVLIKDLTVRSELSLERLAIPGGDALVLDPEIERGFAFGQR